MPRPRHDLRLALPVSPGDPRSEGGGLGDLVALVRWALLPLGLVALVAVGVHAAADTVDDRLLRVVERVDAWLDSVLGAWSVTEAWVERVGPGERVWIARLLALMWELLADALLLFPVLTFRRSAEPGKRRRLQPSPMLVLRPLATAAICVAGACAVARMAQGVVYLSALDTLGEATGPLARGLAVAVLVGVLLALGSRAVVGSFRHAREAVEEARSRAAALRCGLWGSALVIPLAVAALLDAAPVLSFFR